jgi:hypothetical protein
MSKTQQITIQEISILAIRFGHLEDFSVVSKGWFSISEVEHKELVAQMRMARFKDKGNLDKMRHRGTPPIFSILLT